MWGEKVMQRWRKEGHKKARKTRSGVSDLEIIKVLTCPTKFWYFCSEMELSAFGALHNFTVSHGQ